MLPKLVSPGAALCPDSPRPGWGREEGAGLSQGARCLDTASHGEKCRKRSDAQLRGGQWLTYEATSVLLPSAKNIQSTDPTAPCAPTTALKGCEPCSHVPPRLGQLPSRAPPRERECWPANPGLAPRRSGPLSAHSPAAPETQGQCVGTNSGGSTPSSLQLSAASPEMEGASAAGWGAGSLLKWDLGPEAPTEGPSHNAHSSAPAVLTSGLLRLGWQ